MIFDTDFLIAYGKGSKALSKAKARAYVDALPPGEPLLISRVTWMEFAVGYETKAEADAESHRFTVVEFDDEWWFPASRISRDLSRRGQRIGTPDCMIARDGHRLRSVRGHTKPRALLPHNRPAYGNPIASCPAEFIA